MKRTIIAFGILLIAAVAKSAETNFVMKAGDTTGIAVYLPILNKYPLVESSEEAPPHRTIPGVAMWKIGDGVLRVSLTLGAGLITDMSYAVLSNGKETVFKVKAFNIETGEMTIMVPNHGHEGTSDPGRATE